MSDRLKMNPEQMAAMRAQMMNAQANTNDEELGGVGGIPTSERPTMQTAPASQPTPAPTPASQPNPMPQPNPAQTQQARPMSAQEAMMQRMRSNQGQVQQSQSTTMEQGMGYNPAQTAQQQTTVQQAPNNAMNDLNNLQQQAAQQQQVQQQVQQFTEQAQSQQNDTVINTTNTSSGFQWSPMKALAIVGIVLVIIVLLVVVMLKNNSFSFGEKESEEVVDPFDDPSMEWLDPVVVAFKYTTAEIEQLRAAGYTGDEIEDYQTMETPVQDLLDMAEEARKDYLANLAKKYDVTTPEFEEYISQTWLSLPPRTDADEWTEIASYYTDRKNFDYEKVEPHGNQLWLKIYLDDNIHENWFYLNVKPEDWVRLNDYGNVIVNYEYCTRLVHDGEFDTYEDEDSIFITGATLEIIE